VWAGTGIPVEGKSDTFRKHRNALGKAGYVRKDRMEQWFLKEAEDRKRPEGH
jgi:hypothetical protein